MVTVESVMGIISAFTFSLRQSSSVAAVSVMPDLSSLARIMFTALSLSPKVRKRSSPSSFILSCVIVVSSLIPHHVSVFRIPAKRYISVSISGERWLPYIHMSSAVLTITEMFSSGIIRRNPRMSLGVPVPPERKVIRGDALSAPLFLA